MIFAPRPPRRGPVRPSGGNVVRPADAGPAVHPTTYGGGGASDPVWQAWVS